MKHMNLKFSLLSLFVLALAGCNYTYVYQIPKYPGDNPVNSETEEISLPVDTSKTYNLKIWCDARISTLTQSQIGQFMADNPQYKISFRIDNVGEDSAASSIIEDVSSGADIFVFAQDQLNRLKTSGALASINGAMLDNVKANNSAESVAAATLDNKVYAFPFTSDNGYFLMYDKTVVSEADSKDIVKVLEACQKAGKKMNYNIYGSGFYTASYFMATDMASGNKLCKNEWKISKKNKFYDYEDSYNSDGGLIACKALQKLKSFSNISNSDDPSKFGKNLGACVTGMWNYSYAKNAIGDNLACAPMPSYFVDGKEYHLGSFSGYKLIGVKPQEDTSTINLCKLIANFLAGEKCQQQRFDTVEWGPTNNNISATEKVLNQPGLKALSAQGPYSSAQTACPSGWFDAVMALATSIKATDSESDLRESLNNYTAAIDELKEN